MRNSSILLAGLVAALVAATVLLLAPIVVDSFDAVDAGFSPAAVSAGPS